MSKRNQWKYQNKDLEYHIDHLNQFSSELSYISRPHSPTYIIIITPNSPLQNAQYLKTLLQNKRKGLPSCILFSCTNYDSYRIYHLHSMPTTIQTPESEGEIQVKQTLGLPKNAKCHERFIILANQKITRTMLRYVKINMRSSQHAIKARIQTFPAV